MTKNEFENLKPGDVVQNDGSGTAYIVTGNYKEGGVTMVKTILAFNHDEWNRIPPSSPSAE